MGDKQIRDRQADRQRTYTQAGERLRQTGRWRTGEQLRTERQEEDRQTGKGQRQIGRGQTTGEEQTSRWTNRWMNRQTDGQIT